MDNGTTILLVDDDPSVLAYCGHVLSASGYSVLTAKDGMAALELNEKTSGPIELLITDIKMPGMDGSELAKRVCVSRSVIRLLFISGYCDSAAASLDLFEGRADFLGKPFSPAALIQKVHDVLDSVKV